MGAIIMCGTLIVIGLGAVIFERTKAGKKFFGEK